jgi:hypothetical protein
MSQKSPLVQQPTSVPLALTPGISAQRRQVVVVLNGQKTAELDNGLFAEGPFALQHGAGVIKFRKVAIKSL